MFLKRAVHVFSYLLSIFSKIKITRYEQKVYSKAQLDKMLQKREHDTALRYAWNHTQNAKNSIPSPQIKKEQMAVQTQVDVPRVSARHTTVQIQT